MQQFSTIKSFFHRFNRFLFISSFIIGGMWTPNMGGVSAMTIFYFFPFIFHPYPGKYIVVLVFFKKNSNILVLIVVFSHFLSCLSLFIFNLTIGFVYVRYFDSVFLLLISYFLPLLFYQSFYVF